MKRFLLLSAVMVCALMLGYFSYVFYNVLRLVQVENGSKLYSVEVRGIVSKYEFYQEVESLGVFKKNGVLAWNGYNYVPETINKLVVRFVDEKQSMGAMNLIQGGPAVASSFFEIDGSTGVIKVNFDKNFLNTSSADQKNKALNEEVTMSIIRMTKLNDPGYKNIVQLALQKIINSDINQTAMFWFK